MVSLFVNGKNTSYVYIRCMILISYYLFRLLYIADNHDLWHFFSAAGIFMAFLALLTVDDDLLATERNLIEVF